jgi:redox-sensitive bicupin YhaK (pirin superfamily)
VTAHPPSSRSVAGSHRPEAPLLRRPAAERFHSRHAWLDSWHTFSFASHVDPAWMGFGPLRVINDDTIAAGQGFGPHPHRDMEIVTVMVEGQLNHQDSMGHSAVLRAGEVQRMSAGTGIVHSEINGGERSCRLLQIWIQPDAPGHSPAYDQRPFPQVPGWTLLIDPQGVDGAMAIHRPVRLWRGRLDPGQTLLPPTSMESAPSPGWIQLIEGEVCVAFKAEHPATPPAPLDSAAHATGAGDAMVLARGDGLGFTLANAPTGPLTGGSGGADLLWFSLA